MSLWYNFWGHLRTILHHKNLVRHYCFRAGLYKQGIMHDWSKYSPVEFINSVRNFQGGKKSPNFGEKATKGYSSSWLHHKGRNRHHFEYWIDFTLNPDEGCKECQCRPDMCWKCFATASQQAKTTIVRITMILFL